MKYEWLFPSIYKEGTMYKNKSEQPTVFSGFTVFSPGDLVLVEESERCTKGLSIIEWHQIVGTMIVLFYSCFLCAV